MLKGPYTKSETVEINFQYVFDFSKTFSCISFECVIIPSNGNSDSVEKTKTNYGKHFATHIF